MAAEIVSGSRLIVLRHGERADAVKSENWKDPVYPYDPPLTVLGHEQAKEAAVRIHSSLSSAEKVRVVCSPFLRCIQTATHVADELNISKIEIIPQICDMLNEHAHIFSDVKWRWCEKEIDPSVHLVDTSRFECSPDLVFPFYKETLEESGERYRQAFEILRTEHPNDIIIAVCHWYTLEVTLGLKTNSVPIVSAGFCASVEVMTSDWSVVRTHNIS